MGGFERILSDLSLNKNQDKKRSSDYRKTKEELPIPMSSFVEALPEPIPRFHSPRASTPLNLTPPDLGDFVRKSYRREIQTLKEDGNERSVTPDINSERSSDKMARGGSGSTAKQPFLEVLDRCGKLEMENQELKVKCREAEEKLVHLEMRNNQEVEAKCKEAEQKLNQYEKMEKDYQGMDAKCKILQVRLDNLEKELERYKEDSAYVAAEKRTWQAEKAEMIDRLRKVDKEASNSLRIAQAVEKLVSEFRDLKERYDLHLRELEAARTLITDMGMTSMKGPISVINAEKEEVGDKAEAASATPEKNDLEKNVLKKNKTLSASWAPGRIVRFGVGSDTVTPPPNRLGASLFGSRDDHGFQGDCSLPGKLFESEKSDKRDWRKDKAAFEDHLETKKRKQELGSPSRSILEKEM